VDDLRQNLIDVSVGVKQSVIVDGIDVSMPAFETWDIFNIHRDTN